MKKIVSVCCTLVVLMVLGGVASAEDFETVGATYGEGYSLTTEVPGVRFERTIIAEAGTPRVAFGAAAGDDTGLDPAHIPARKAYEGVGFDRQIPSVEYWQDLGRNNPGSVPERK